MKAVRSPHINLGKGDALVRRLYGSPHRKVWAERLRGARQAEREDRSGTVSLPTQDSHAQQLTAEDN
eukprot:1149364-Pelagomonas_calceolata.AAC.9